MSWRFQPISEKDETSAIELLHSEFGDEQCDLSYWTRYVAMQLDKFHGVFKDNKLIGIASLENRLFTGSVGGIDNKAIWIMNLLVITEFRKQGIGRAFVEHLLWVSKQKGHDIVYISTEDKTEEFYKKLGWESLDFAMFFSGHTEVIYYKDIGG